MIEPLVSTQWFVKVAPLAEPAIEAVEQGRTRFVPDTWSKTYFEWMRNIHDWCISRQLWWGHRIPAWYCDACDETIVAEETRTECDAAAERLAPGRGRAGHLVLLGAVAVLHAGLARARPRPRRTTTRRSC